MAAADIFVDRRDLTGVAKALNVPPSELIERVEHRVAQTGLDAQDLDRRIRGAEVKTELRRLTDEAIAAVSSDYFPADKVVIVADHLLKGKMALFR